MINKQDNLIHKPVLLNEVLELLKPSDNGRFIDATVGCGGHSTEILKCILPAGFLWCIDCDSNAISIADKKLTETGKNFCIIKDNFKNLSAIARNYNINNLNGILFDLGMSSLQLDSDERGFSFRKDCPLDMRFDNDSNVYTAKNLVNNLSFKELQDIIFKYGEERYASRIARAIVKECEAKRIETTTELADIIRRVIPGPPVVKNDAITRTFQALRIAVNTELDALKTVLPVAVSLLKSGGRLAVISFHSLEDRIIKFYFKHESKDCICNPEQPVCNCNHQAQLKLLFKKPITPTKQEKTENNRARSAKLRVAEKL